jgi:hypothetical protein
MGDTLTHLARKADVSALFQDVFDALHSGGVFVITYRSLTQLASSLCRKARPEDWREWSLQSPSVLS